MHLTRYNSWQVWDCYMLRHPGISNKLSGLYNTLPVKWRLDFPQDRDVGEVLVPSRRNVTVSIGWTVRIRFLSLTIKLSLIINCSCPPNGIQLCKNIVQDVKQFLHTDIRIYYRSERKCNVSDTNVPASRIIIPTPPSEIHVSWSGVRALLLWVLCWVLKDTNPYPPK